jgi:hypothetical protein
VKYINNVFFGKIQVDIDPSIINNLISECGELYKSSIFNQSIPVKMTLEQSYLFQYYKIEDGENCIIYIGPSHLEEFQKDIKPFVMYNRKVKDMGLNHIKDRLFYLKLFKDSKPQ